MLNGILAASILAFVNTANAGDVKSCNVAEGSTIYFEYRSVEMINAEEKRKAITEMRNPVEVTDPQVTISFTGTDIDSVRRNQYPIILMQSDQILHRYTETVYLEAKAPYQTGNGLWFNTYSTTVPVKAPFTAYVVSTLHTFRCAFEVSEGGIVGYPEGHTATNQARFQP